MVYDDSIGFSFLDILWALHFVSLKVRPESFDQGSNRFRSDWRDTTSPADLTSFKRSCVVGKHSDVTLLYHIRNFEGSFDGRTSSSTAVNESGHNWYLRETFHCERLFVFYVKLDYYPLNFCLCRIYSIKCRHRWLQWKLVKCIPRISLVKRSFEEMNVLVVAATSLKFKSVFLHAHNEQWLFQDNFSVFAFAA